MVTLDENNARPSACPARALKCVFHVASRRGAAMMTVGAFRYRNGLTPGDGHLLCEPFPTLIIRVRVLTQTITRFGAYATFPPTGPQAVIVHPAKPRSSPAALSSAPKHGCLAHDPRPSPPLKTFANGVAHDDTLLSSSPPSMQNPFGSCCWSPAPRCCVVFSCSKVALMGMPAVHAVLPGWCWRITGCPSSRTLPRDSRQC